LIFKSLYLKMVNWMPFLLVKCLNCLILLLIYWKKNIKVFKSCLNCQKSCFSWGIIITDRNENICYSTLKYKVWFTAKIISFKCIFSIVSIILYFVSFSFFLNESVKTLHWKALKWSCSRIFQFVQQRFWS